MRWALAGVIVAILATDLTMQSDVAAGADVQMSGHVSNLQFRVEYQEQAREVRVAWDTRAMSFPLAGYAVRDLLVTDLRRDGNDQIIFSDVVGVSSGGDLRCLIWSGSSFSDEDTGFAASSVKVMEESDARYLLLIQHDTEDLFFVSDILTLNGSKLVSSTSRVGWEAVVREFYEPHMMSTSDAWKLGRYNSYTAMAFDKANLPMQASAYRQRASKFDPDNPFLRRRQ